MLYWKYVKNKYKFILPVNLHGLLKRFILSNLFLRETLREVLHLLRSTGNTQVEYIIRIMKKWAKENRVPI